MSTTVLKDPLVQIAVGTIAISTFFFAFLVNLSFLWRGLVAVGSIFTGIFTILNLRK